MNHHDLDEVVTRRQLFVAIAAVTTSLLILIIAGTLSFAVFEHNGKDRTRELLLKECARGRALVALEARMFDEVADLHVAQLRDVVSARVELGETESAKDASDLLRRARALRASVADFVGVSSSVTCS